MSFLSQLLKGNKNEEALEETDETLDTQEEGLLMSTGGQEGGEMAGQSGVLDAVDAPEGEAAAAVSPWEAQEQTQTDDLVEAAGGGAIAPARSNAPEDAALRAAALQAPPAGQAAPAAEATEEGSVPEDPSDEPDDDPLAAFRSTTVEGGLGNLAKEVEDIPVEEIIADLRDIRSMLSVTPLEAEMVTDDGQEV